MSLQGLCGEPNEPSAPTSISQSSNESAIRLCRAYENRHHILGLVTAAQPVSQPAGNSSRKTLREQFLFLHFVFIYFHNQLFIYVFVRPGNLIRNELEMKWRGKRDTKASKNEKNCCHHLSFRYFTYIHICELNVYLECGGWVVGSSLGWTMLYSVLIPESQYSLRAAGTGFPAAEQTHLIFECMECVAWRVFTNIFM